MSTDSDVKAEGGILGALERAARLRSAMADVWADPEVAAHENADAAALRELRTLLSEWYERDRSEGIDDNRDASYRQRVWAMIDPDWDIG